MTIQELMAYAKEGYKMIDRNHGLILEVFDIGEKCIVLKTPSFKTIRKDNCLKYEPYREKEDL